jgi:serine/threonine protein kinase
MSDSQRSEKGTRKARPGEVPEALRPDRTGPWASAATSQKGVRAQIGRFEVRNLLGEGAFAFVYLAFDPDLEREVAIKVPKAEEMTPEACDLFLRENRLAAIIQHPNICPVYEVGTDEGLPYIVMRMVPNTLAGLLKRLNGAMPARTAVAVVRKLALGLVAAHAQKVIHRDLKPANILYDDVQREVMIADFGLARFADQAPPRATACRRGRPRTWRRSRRSVA